MPFIGQQPITGAYSVLDDITTSATATYNLQLNSAAYSPASANNLLVSLNGVIQKPGSSFTISGSQITFSSALTSSDSIDFIIALGDVLSVGTPTDGSVSTASLAPSAVTDAKIAASTITNAKLAGSITDAKLSTPGAFKFISRTVVTTSVSAVEFDNLSTDYDSFWVTFTAHPNTDNVGMYFQFLDSNGSAINSGSMYGYSTQRLDDSAYHDSSNGNNRIMFANTNCGNAQHEGISGQFFLNNRNFDESNDQHPPHITGMCNQTNTSGNSNQYSFAGGLAVNPAEDIRGMKMYFSSGSIEEGVFALYGVVKS